MPQAYPDLVQPTIVAQGTKPVLYCACTRTKTPPFCDNSHIGSGIKPHVVRLEQPTTVAMCRCWKSKQHPFCDGTHARLVAGCAGPK